MSKIQENKEKISSPQAQNEQGNTHFVQVPLEVLEAEISTSAMKLYLMLLKYARQSNECWPSQQTLGRDMSLKARRIADLLKELENAALITIISRAKEGLSNLYRLLKVVQSRGSSGASSQKPADLVAKKDIPGKQKKTREDMQDIADESHAVEIHALNTHIHIQPAPVKEMPFTKRVSFEQQQGVCGSRNSKEETSLKGEALIEKAAPGLLHIPPSESTVEKVITILTKFGVAEGRARQLAGIVRGAKLDEEYVQGLAEWIQQQAAYRKIYNPAGLLVQMVHQLAPVPLPKGVGVPTLNSLQLEAEQKREYFDKHLPRLIAIEERNLADAVSERDKASIKLRLDKYLALQVKDKERAYPYRGTTLTVQTAIDNSQAFFMEQS